MWQAAGMPWIPELFSAAASERLGDTVRPERFSAVPYFDGLMAGDPAALVGSFAGVPELYDPVRGRIKGVAAFERFVTETAAWLAKGNAVTEHVDSLVSPTRTVEEVVLRLDGDAGPIGLPVVVIADRDDDARLVEVRVYYSTWPLNGRHTVRNPVLQLDPDLQLSDVIAEYQVALGGGDPDAGLAAFEPDGYVREPGGTDYIHRGHAALRAGFEFFFSNGGGIPLERCAAADDGRLCAFEYNVVRWGETLLPPQAGAAVYVRAESGRIATARVYDDLDPPLVPPQR
jgi:hypothetical protein